MARSTTAASACGGLIRPGPSQDPWLVGGRLRAAYFLPLNTFSLRPYRDLDLIHAQHPGFAESGLEGLPLTFSASHKTAFLLAPMLEFGGQHQLDLWLLVVRLLRPHPAASCCSCASSRWRRRFCTRAQRSSTRSLSALQMVRTPSRSQLTKPARCSCPS